ncbi:MAG: HAMP domain-containing sensor histidine kinase [Leptolyngbyaceae cyanobacterium bins.59]|nr:HAMP domain-containing sensor histidine kinase [Leptolyngbyaceae cyanobacterium bins.59]
MKKATLKILAFFLGLSIGLALLAWQRLQFNDRLKELLRCFGSSTPDSSFSTFSRLAVTIARQRSTYSQLETELEHWKQVLYLAPLAYLQVDEENCLIWCNPQARQLLHIHEWEPGTPRLLLELVRSYELDHLIEQSRFTQKPYQQDWLFHPVSNDPASSPKLLACALRGFGIPLPGGGVGVFLENRQEAMNLMQQRDRWTSDVAHELKTPLTSIRLVAETLQSRLAPPLQGWIDRLLKETVRLSTLVQDLLDLSQIETGGPYCLNLKSTDLVPLIQSAWSSLEPLARTKQLQLSYTGPDSLIIQADEPRLYRVLINLLDNGIKYSPPKETIWVRASRVPLPDVIPEGTDKNSLNSPVVETWIRSQQTTEGAASEFELVQSDEMIQLEVIDAGPGFPEDALPHVFERFYRADPSRARYPLPSLTSSSLEDSSPASSAALSTQVYSSSSGLGLAIVRQIVEAHQGHVTASNSAEIGGAWLHVFLPCRGIDPG